MMTIVGFTNTQAPLPPPTDPYSPTTTLWFRPFSFFWGGAITDIVGAFAQLTYNAPGPADLARIHSAHTWTWDNTDVRFARLDEFGNIDAIFGITANNDPTVQDPWNTTPAWAFPYAISTIADRRGPARSSRALLRHMSSAQRLCLHQRPALSGSVGLSDA